MYYGLSAIAAMVLTGLFWRGHSGPYGLVADLQQSLWGVNLLQLSLLACWAVLYAPMHVVVRTLEKRSGVKRDPLAWQRFVALFTFLSDTRPGQVVGLGSILFLMGGWFLTSAMTSGPLTTLAVADAEAGEQPASRYVRLTGGKILLDSQLSFTRNGSVELYYPVIATTDPREPERFTVFARLDGANAGRLPEALVGELEFDGLPGALRSILAAKDRLAPRYFVVRHGRDPSQQTSFLTGMCGLGAVAIVVGLLWARSRKAAPQAE